MGGMTMGVAGWMGSLAALELKGGVILMLAALAALLLRRHSASARHGVWVMAVAGLLVLPLAQRVAPTWSPALPAWAAKLSVPVANSGMTEPAAPAEEGLSGERMAAMPGASSSQENAVEGPVAPRTARSHKATVPTTPVTGSGEAPAGSDGPTLPFPVLLMAVWALGAVGLLTSLAMGHLSVARLQRFTEAFPEGRVTTLAGRLAEELGIRRRVSLRVGRRDAMPVSWGWLRPAILLPPEAESWTPRRLTAVLLHELAHIKRADTLTQALAEVARAIHWPNPLAWLAVRRLRVEREYACDDLVLRAGARASDYADELIALSRSLRPAPALRAAAVAMARPSTLAGRLRAVLDGGRKRTLGRGSVTMGIGIAAGLVLALAALAPASPAPASQESPGSDAQDVVVQDARTPARAGGSLDDAPRSLDSRDLAALQEASCGMARSGWNNLSTNSNNGRVRIQWSRPGCDIEVRMEGDVEFTSDFKDVASLSRDGMLRIEEDNGRTLRWLEITPDGSGRPKYEYRQNRDEAAFDADARVWYQALILQLVRRAGFMAEERVAALLKEGGPDAVIRELDQLDSDFVFATYAKELLKQAPDLSDGQALEVVSRTADRVDSDFYISEVLKAFAPGHLGSNDMVDAYLRAARKLDSDFYRSEVLKAALDRGNLTSAQVAATLEAASEMDSDFYISEVLNRVAAQYSLESGMRETYLRTVSGMDSDFYITEVLKRLLDRNQLSDSEMEAVLQVASTMDSGSYVSQILGLAAKRGLTSDALVNAYVDVAGGIDSDSYRSAVLKQVAHGGQLTQAQVLRVIRATAEMDSDFYKAEVLGEVARGYRMQGSVMDAMRDAMDSIDSDFYRGQVAQLVLKR